MEQTFSQLIFGKRLTDITLVDLQTYFQTPRIESDKLEFKSFYSQTAGGSGKEKEEEKKVLRTISAFLNSEGGIVIWGAPIGTKIPEQKEPVFQGPLTPGNVYYEKDAFIGKIANKIVSSPKGILFHRVENQGKYLYLFETSASEYAPHQLENIYYMRMDGQTLPAPHHYIEAMFRKVSFPKLEAYLRVDNYKYENGQGILDCTLIFRNQSRYQNDENLHCRIISDQGKVLRSDSSASPNDQMLISGSDYFASIADTIYYGNYLHHQFKIIFSRDNLYHSDHEATLLIAFGARYSPMKINHYTLKVGPVFPKNKNEAIIYKKENLFFHENEEANGMTDVDVLNRILNDNNSETL
jgi:hypothetical protein